MFAAKAKFKIDSSIKTQIVLESDGTLVEDEDFFKTLERYTSFMILRQNEDFSLSTIEVSILKYIFFFLVILSLFFIIVECRVSFRIKIWSKLWWKFECIFVIIREPISQSTGFETSNEWRNVQLLSIVLDKSIEFFSENYYVVRD